MGGGLVGDDVDGHAAAQQLGQHLGAVADHPDRQARRSRGRGCARARPRRRGRRRARRGSGARRGGAAGAGSTSTTRQTPPFSVTASGCAPPMPPQPPVTVSVPASVPAEPLGGDGGERLVGALQDPLGADVDPRARGHLAVHGEAELLEAAELGPGGPVADEVGVGDQHPRRPLVRPQHADRPAGLDEHRLVVLEGGQGAHHGVERAPVAGGAAGAAVDDEVVGPLGDLGVEVVLQHAQRGLGLPGPGGQGGAARCADGACALHGSLLLVGVAAGQRSGSGDGLGGGQRPRRW